MSWYHKEQPTPFDNKPLSGLFYLDGDLLARKLLIDWTKGEKMPMLMFPSGLEFELWGNDKPNGEVVHLFGELDLRLHDTRDGAYGHASHIAGQVGYIVRKIGLSQLEIIGHEQADHLLLTYDAVQHLLVNVEKVTLREYAVRPQLPLLDTETRRRLPPLYSTEKQGENAVAQGKFFTPDAGWSWYPTEFDGRDSFFGLVVGFETELGYFSLSELQSIRGPLSLPVERDKHFAPKTLADIRKEHER